MDSMRRMVSLTMQAVLAAFLYAGVYAQDKPAYCIFTGDGKKASYGEILSVSLKSDVVFFGELHDNPVSHWLELELAKDLFSSRGKELAIAAEMFETDNQLIVDEYFAGFIRESSFESEARLWPNYKTDYRPLLNFAREKGLKFIASNVPRRYASAVASGGFDALGKLSPAALAFIAPLPLEYDPGLPCYRDILSAGAHIGTMMKSTGENLAKAQALKDATMAHSIAVNRRNGMLIFHINGGYHSRRNCGIIWYLERYSPGLRVTTVSTAIQDNIDNLKEENRGMAYFIIAVPASMTRTH